ncbi:MAG: MFS transporter [Limosilactobacillus sp.]|nr:MFS transporter [Limosilactobacillus sp.]
MKTTTNRWRLSLSLYLGYFIHGFGLIILAQNMTSLGHLWHVPLATVSYVISGVGIGRLLAYLITGYLSDRFSRKAFVNLGLVAYLMFALGILCAPNIQVAYLCAILAGIANSALDAGTYATLVELHDGGGQGTVIIKAFMSAGEFILPLIVAYLDGNHHWFGWSFILMAGLIILNLINLNRLQFPKPNQTSAQNAQQVQSLAPWRRRGLTALLCAYGYTSMALMILFTQWVSLYTNEVLHFGNVASHLVLSMYSVGSITGVLVLYWLLKSQRAEIKLMLGLNTLALLALSGLFISHQAILVQGLAFVFGFSAAGGVMQTGLALFMKLHPHMRGMITGIYYFFGSIASFTIPLITGRLSQVGTSWAFGFDLVIAVLGLSLVIGMQVMLGKEVENG